MVSRTPICLGPTVKTQASGAKEQHYVAGRGGIINWSLCQNRYICITAAPK